MPKSDLKKELKQFFTASAKKPALVDVPKLKYLMIDGSGDPNGIPGLPPAMEAMYSVAYTLKFALKLGPQKLDWTVMPPEGLWWTEDGSPFDEKNKAAWRWTLIMVVPDFVTAATLRHAIKTVKEKKGLARADDVRLGSWREGKAVQMMHIGPYSETKITVEKLLEFAAENGCTADGKYHEIYFSDPRRTKPEKLKTLARVPVKKTAR